MQSMSAFPAKSGSRDELSMTAGGSVKPNPGSDEAMASGCICAVLDNNHGKWAPWGDDSWWTNEGCSVHAYPQSGRSNG
jgi:hypothetical protein